jgi:hypothetical protein
MSYDYKSLVLSTARAAIAYMDPSSVNDLWANSSNNTKNIVYYVFFGVLQAPKYINSKIVDANVYCWIQNKTLHIVFRGTSSKRDAAADLYATQSPLFIGNKLLQVHDGFLIQFRSIQIQLLAEITTNIKNVDTVHFSGHSLGGALAIIASCAFSDLIKRTNGKRIVCHTVGAPRVGNRVFSEYYKQRTDESVRIQNHKDPIPLIPASMYYFHVNDGLELLEDGTVITRQTDVPWYSRGKLINFKNPAGPHSIKLYLERLVKLAAWEIEYLFK